MFLLDSVPVLLQEAMTLVSHQSSIVTHHKASGAGTGGGEIALGLHPLAMPLLMNGAEFAQEDGIVTTR